MYRVIRAAHKQIQTVPFMFAEDLLACVRNKLAVGLATLSLTFMFVMSLIRIVHPKMKIMSSFTPPHVVLNLYDFLASVEDKERYFEECW